MNVVQPSARSCTSRIPNVMIALLITLNVVTVPAPFGPRMETISPRLIKRNIIHRLFPFKNVCQLIDLRCKSQKPPPHIVNLFYAVPTSQVSKLCHKNDVSVAIYNFKSINI